MVEVTALIALACRGASPSSLLWKFKTVWRSLCWIHQKGQAVLKITNFYKVVLSGLATKKITLSIISCRATESKYKEASPIDRVQVRKEGERRFLIQFNLFFFLKDDVWEEADRFSLSLCIHLLAMSDQYTSHWKCVYLSVVLESWVVKKKEYILWLTERL